ncbi:MAG: hypothetical protein MHPSP_002562, partial [Paramarteilia canceri]
MADVKLCFNNYKKIQTCSTTSKTLITQNPNTREGLNLHRFSKRVQNKMTKFQDDDEDDKSN